MTPAALAATYTLIKLKISGNDYSIMELDTTIFEFCVLGEQTFK